MIRVFSILEGGEISSVYIRKGDARIDLDGSDIEELIAVLDGERSIINIQPAEAEGEYQVLHNHER